MRKRGCRGCPIVIVLPAYFLFLLMTVFCGLSTAGASSFEEISREGETREPAIAGTWYPGSPEMLRKQVEGFLEKAPPADFDGTLVALIAPHAGYTFSGQVAAYAYKLLEKHRFDSVVIIGPSHHARFSGVAVYSRGGFRTPLGIVPLDHSLISALERKDPHIRHLAEAHAREHSIEIQLPFLQVVLPDFKLVPLVMGEQDFSTCRRLADALYDSIGGRSVLVVASSDLSHFHSSEVARKLDQTVMDRVAALDPQGLSTLLAGGKSEACGGGPMVTAMLLASRLGADRSRVLKYADSSDVTGIKNDPRGVVGYMAAAIWADSRSRTEARKDAAKSGVDSGLSPADKHRLRCIASESIEAGCRGAAAPVVRADSPGLRSTQGAFVTLKRNGELRGCIGRVISDAPLAETVSRMAAAAAFEDPRFQPVTKGELEDLTIEISVLTPPRRIQSTEEIQVGIHGIIMTRNGSAGLLLPQVPVEQGWDRRAFLEHACLKARLPKDAYRDAQTEIYVFSADVF